MNDGELVAGAATNGDRVSVVTYGEIRGSVDNDAPVSTVRAGGLENLR